MEGYDCFFSLLAIMPYMMTSSKYLGSGGFLFCVTRLGVIAFVEGEMNEGDFGCTELELCYKVLYVVFVAMP